MPVYCRSFLARAGVASPGRRRHCQLPPRVPGVFIRASAPRPRQSCICATKVSATEAMPPRIMPQWKPSASLSPRYFRAKVRSALAVWSRHWTTVSLSWVPT